MLPLDNTNIDYVYKKVDDKELKLTFLSPLNIKHKNAPVYFIIPGGGWHSADRQSMIDFSKTSVEMLREQGFAVVSIEYRTTNEKCKICDIIEDCFDALGFLGEKSDELKIDTEKIVVSGHSAGAHLALMVAFADGNLFTKKYKNLPKIAVATALSPATVLYQEEFPKTIGFGISNLFNNPDDLIERKKASPIEYVNSQCPPTILFAGTDDPLIYSESSKILFDKLISSKVKSELVLSQNAGHSFEKLSQEKEVTISFEKIQTMLVDFVLQNI